MDLSITEVPAWLSIAFILCFASIPVFLITNAVHNVFKTSNPKKGALLTRKIILFYALYFAIVAVISLTGFFKVNVIPPRIILFSTIPLLFFYLFYVQKTDWFKFIFKQIKIEQIIFIHLFRFVGVFFLLVYLYDAIPKQFALVGGIGDIVTAVLVLPVIWVVKRKMPFAKVIVWLWNIIGVIDIISVLATAIIVTKMAAADGDPGVQQFGTFPFSWIPAFAPATIIFLHIIIFRKLKENTINKTP